MPDLMTHFLSAHLARRGAEGFAGGEMGPRRAVMFYVGTLLPDLFSKPPTILLDDSWVYWLTMPTHTLLAVVLMAYLLVMFLDQADRSAYFRLCLAGAGLHFVLDLLQKHVSGGAYYFLFPFSWQTFHLPVYWPSDTVLAIPVLLLVIAVVEALRRRTLKAKAA